MGQYTSFDESKKKLTSHFQINIENTKSVLSIFLRFSYGCAMHLFQYNLLHHVYRFRLN